MYKKVKKYKTEINYTGTLIPDEDIVEMIKETKKNTQTELQSILKKKLREMQSLPEK